MILAMYIFFGLMIFNIISMIMPNLFKSIDFKPLSFSDKTLKEISNKSSQPSIDWNAYSKLVTPVPAKESRWYNSKVHSYDKIKNTHSFKIGDEFLIMYEHIISKYALILKVIKDNNNYSPKYDTYGKDAYTFLSKASSYVFGYEERSFRHNRNIYNTLCKEYDELCEQEFFKLFSDIGPFKPRLVMNQSDGLINKISEKHTRLNNTISNSLLETASDLHSLYRQYNDETSQKEIIRQLEAISEFLDTQIEKACLPGSKAYIDKQLRTSSFYIKSVIDNDNWVE